VGRDEPSFVSFDHFPSRDDFFLSRPASPSSGRVFSGCGSGGSSSSPSSLTSCRDARSGGDGGRDAAVDSAKTCLRRLSRSPTSLRCSPLVGRPTSCELGRGAISSPTVDSGVSPSCSSTFPPIGDSSRSSFLCSSSLSSPSIRIRTLFLGGVGGRWINGPVISVGAGSAAFPFSAALPRSLVGDRRVLSENEGLAGGALALVSGKSSSPEESSESTPGGANIDHEAWTGHQCSNTIGYERYR
jgi:hypothetical protein